MSRIYNLDYLRGLAAFGIMIYHYLSWTIGEFTANTFMQRVGIYGVSIFYVLSGLTLYHVYNHKMVPTKSDILDFAKKRFFRIYPLLALTTLAAFFFAVNKPGWEKVVLNITGLFGFIKWEAYISTGAWSIGNELVFYVFFPFFILFSKRIPVAMYLLSAAIFFCYLFFAFHVLSPDQDLSTPEQWRNYVNPLNQVFLFLAGFLMGRGFQTRELPRWLKSLLLVAGVFIFIAYPVHGDAIGLVTGIARLVFTAACFFICIAFYKSRIKLPNFIHKPLSLLGEASYSVYLLHPIVYKMVANFTQKYYVLADVPRLVLCVLATLVISFLVYTYFEKFFMKLGRGKKVPAIQ